MLLRSALIQLSPDFTLPLMWIVFMVVVWGLNRLIFRPTLNLLDARHSKSEGLQVRARSLMEENKKGLASYEELLHQARLRAATEREAIIAEARRQEREILEAARQKIDQRFADLRGQLGLEKERVRKQLARDAEALAFQITEKILERKVA